jgi:hypothetical protein
MQRVKRENIVEVLCIFVGNRTMKFTENILRRGRRRMRENDGRGEYS